MAELIRYRAVHDRSQWRKVNSHRSMESALSGRDGARGLFAGKVRISYETHGTPRYVVVWQEGSTAGIVARPGKNPGEIETASIPIAHIQRFESAGMAPQSALAGYFT